jgi:hypothetical protein
MKLKIYTVLSILLFINNVSAQTDVVYFSGFERLIRINDTGIVFAGNYPSDNTNCGSSNIASPQDCDSGRDVTHNDGSDGYAGFSFTKLDVNGNPLAASAPEWSCVKDNVTGLTWEVKTVDGGIHDIFYIFKWGGLTAIGKGHPDAQGSYFDDWNNLINASNSENFCGLNNWRVPTIGELFGLANLSGNGSAVLDSNYFPEDVYLINWWSADPVPGTNSIFAKGMEFYTGSVYPYERTTRNHLRLVHSLTQ